MLSKFWELASADEKKRLAAAEELVASVNDAETLEYSLKRLVRGLPSSRDAARLGFSLALTQLLSSKSTTLSINSVIDLLIQFTQTASAMKGSELRDVLFGRLFGLHAIIQSDLVPETAVSDEMRVDIHRIVDLALELSLAKEYLKQAAFAILVRLTQKLGNCNKELIAEIAEKVLEDGVNDAEHLWFSITIESMGTVRLLIRINS